MKKIVIYAIFAALCILILTGMSGLPESSIKIRKNDKILALENEPVMINDRVYVSVRNLCEAFGMKVDWDGETNTVLIDEVNRRVTVSETGKKIAGEIIPDEETAIVIGKAVLEKYLGKEVEYETDEKSVYLKAAKFGNTWSVYQIFLFKNGKGWAGNIRTYSVKIDAYTGQIESIGTVSDIDKLN